MFDKTAFYQRHGVEECYLYDPETGGLEVVSFTGDGMRFYPIDDEWVSPRLGVRFVPQPRAPMETLSAGR
jgi:Uma2 family endonuclease